MKSRHIHTLTKAAIIALLALSVSPIIASAERNDNDSNGHLFHYDGQHQFPHQRACGRTDDGQNASCNARVLQDASGRVKSNTAPIGYGPVQLRTAYNVSGKAGAKRIIAITDAYDDPNIQNDLNVYSSTFGLPALPACVGSIASSATPCFKKVDQNGGTRYPQVSSGWALEIALDVETAHAMCQDCSVLLVEASSSSYNNLMTSINTAVNLGANVVSNSWGSSEFSGETSYDSYLNHPNIPITFSSGDSGYGAQYPATSKYVVAVGGTTLVMNGTAYGSETAWSGAGSGCSLYESKPSWQTDTGCSKRAEADVSADADPNSGAAIYDSVTYQNVRGWFQVGGTSLASPIVASVYALSGITSANPAQLIYSNSAALHDVVSGSNGSCGGSYLCTAKPGYDGPTGLGTPNGTGAF